MPFPNPNAQPHPIDIARQADMLAQRVRKTFRHLHKGFQRQQIGAFRLYDWDIPEIRVVIDWVEGHLLVGEYARAQTDALPHLLPTLATAVAQALTVPHDHVHLRRRHTRPQDGGERYKRLDRSGEGVEVREGDLRFWCNLSDYLDIGLFPDHRPTRRLVREQAQGTDFLNLFGYTGSFTVAAAAGGARTTTTVDVSQPYLDWTGDNLRRNGFDGPEHAMVRSDATAFLGRSRREGRRFTLAVLDPPSFSTSQTVGRDFDVQRDHRNLVADTLAVLEPQGILWFSTNHQRFEPQLEGLGATVEDWTERTIPADYRNRRVHSCWRLVKAG